MLKSANPDSSLASKFYKRCGAHPRFSATKQERVDEQFVIKHYAGDVCYSCEGLVERNRVRLGDPTTRFVHADVVSGAALLPSADLIFSRQMLQHLCTEDALRFVRLVAR